MDFLLVEPVLALRLSIILLSDELYGAPDHELEIVGAKAASLNPCRVECRGIETASGDQRAKRYVTFPNGLAFEVADDVLQFVGDCLRPGELLWSGDAVCSDWDAAWAALRVYIARFSGHP
jgi:hypothetical protein